MLYLLSSQFSLVRFRHYNSVHQNTRDPTMYNVHNWTSISTMMISNMLMFCILNQMCQTNNTTKLRIQYSTSDTHMWWLFAGKTISSRNFAEVKMFSFELFCWKYQNEEIYVPKSVEGRHHVLVHIILFLFFLMEKRWWFLVLYQFDVSDGELWGWCYVYKIHVARYSFSKL